MATPRSAVRAAERRTVAAVRPPGLRSVVPSLVLLLALAASGAAIYGVTDGLTAWTLDQRRDTRIAAGVMRLPAIDVRNQQGGRARWFGADGAGPRIYLVDFVYTRCLTVCRALGAEFTQLQEQIARDGLAGRIGLRSLSFDPRDDVPDLAGYARQHRARLPGWDVAGPVAPAAMRMLLRDADVLAIADGLGGFEHNGGLHVVDAHGRILAAFPLEEFRQAYAFARRQLDGEEGGRP